MTSLMLQHGLASRGRFILIAPQLNRRAQAVATLYRTELSDPDGAGDPATVGFSNITLETFIGAMHEAGATDLARQLWARYCDHARVAQFALQGYDPSSPPPVPNRVCSQPPSSTDEAAPVPAPPPAVTRRSRSRRPPAAASVERSTQSAESSPSSATAAAVRGAR